jgi:hypothetical protein
MPFLSSERELGGFWRTKCTPRVPWSLISQPNIWGKHRFRLNFRFRTFPRQGTMRIFLCQDLFLSWHESSHCLLHFTNE